MTVTLPHFLLRGLYNYRGIVALAIGMSFIKKKMSTVDVDSIVLVYIPTADNYYYF